MIEFGETVVADDEHYGIGELAEEAGVSIRTVRYYIAEGLLPPPVVAGAKSHYTRSHLDRLRLIGRMKEAYLPLREIRRRMDGLAETEVAQLAAEPAQEAVADLNLPVPGVGFIHGREDIRSSRPARSEDTASSYIARVLGRSARPREPAAALREEPVELAAAMLPAPSAPAPSEAAAPEEGSAWRRIPIGEDAELLIREEAYGRRRDKIDWLVGWARRVLG